MIITITGDIGSGKSTVGKLLVKAFNCEFLSTGKIQRKIAEEMNMSTLELNLHSEKDNSIDDKIDNYTRSLNDSDEDYIVDSRLAWHFIPSSFKVYLKCEPEEAAKRISKDSNRLGETPNSDRESMLQEIVARRASEKRRFFELYNVDYTSLHHYNLIVDTTTMPPNDVCEEVIKSFKVWDMLK